MSSEALIPDTDSSRSSSESRLSQRDVKGHVILGVIQVTVGIELVFLSAYCLLGRSCLSVWDWQVTSRKCFQSVTMEVSIYVISVYDGFWSGPFFIVAGATWLIGGRRASSTLYCIISCMLLSILAVLAGICAIFLSVSGLISVGLQCPEVLAWLLLYALAIVTATVQATFACAAFWKPTELVTQPLQAIPEAAEVQVTGTRSSSSGSYSSHVPNRVLRGHVIMGVIQIAMGCHLVFLAVYGRLQYDPPFSVKIFSGFWTGPLFIATGVTGVAGGRRASRTRCFIISCLVLSILALCMCFVTNTVLAAYGVICAKDHSFDCFTFADLLWSLLYLLEFVAAIVQAGFACRASCCLFPVRRVYE